MSIEEWLKDEARKEGRQEGVLDVAKEMLKRGIALDSIIEMTGLTQEQVLSFEK